MTVAMPFLQKLITFLWPPDISRGLFFDPADQAAKMKKIGGKLDSIGSRWYG